MNKLKQISEDGLKRETDEARRLHEEMKHATPFRRLETLAGLVTFGSNIPLFTFTFGPARIYPLTRAPYDDAGGTLEPAFPGNKLPVALQQSAQWLNFYSKRDVLGYPLKPLNEYFDAEPRIEDICVRSESRISRILPYLVEHLRPYRLLDQRDGLEQNRGADPQYHRSAGHRSGAGRRAPFDAERGELIWRRIPISSGRRKSVQAMVCGVEGAGRSAGAARG